jgi:hypothetical protein
MFEFQLTPSTAAAAISSSPSLRSKGSLTSISSATAFTPLTRRVAFSAPSLGLILHMSGHRDYASICRAPICAASTLGSQLNSSTTSLLRSLSDDMISPRFRRRSDLWRTVVRLAIVSDQLRFDGRMRLLKASPWDIGRFCGRTRKGRKLLWPT